MPTPRKKSPEFRSMDRETAKKMLRDFYQKQGGKQYMKKAQQPSMFQDKETGEFIARPQSFGYGGKMKKYKKGGFPDLTGDGKVTMADILKGRGVDRK